MLDARRLASGGMESSKGRLGAVFVRFTAPEDLLEDHAEIRDLLTSKYGRPWRRGATRRVKKYRESIDLAWLLTKTAASMPSLSPIPQKSPAPEVAAQPPATEEQQPAVVSPEEGVTPAARGADTDELSDSEATSTQEQLAQVDDVPEPGEHITRDGRVVVASWHAPATEVNLIGYWTRRENLLTLHYESAAYANDLREELAALLATQRRQRARDL